MQKYFLEENDFLNKIITGDDCHHIRKVMRNKVGDKVLVGFDSHQYLVTISNISEKEISFDIDEEIVVNNELPVLVSIFQGYPKGDKFEDIIKHGTELGAYEFIPVLMKRSLFNVDEKRQTNKIVRFNKIVKEAAEQSFRNIVPKVKDFIKLTKIDFSSFDYIFICFEESAKNGELIKFKETIKKLKKGDKIAIIIGPEGGIDNDEIDYLNSLGAVVGSLGHRILRTETAGFYCLSAISYEMELAN